MHPRVRPNEQLVAIAVTALAFSLLTPGQQVQAQPLFPRAPVAAPPPANKPAAVSDGSARDPGEQRFPGGATLKTGPEQQRLLQRAEQCVRDGRLDLAAVLWQKVLDEAGDTLMTRDGRTYTSLAEHVERGLARLPPLALAAYRTSADAEARALLAGAGPDGEEEALAQVVRRFFLSSIGDDAAYKLACLALDRHDFLGASRLLNKVLVSHPDPSIPRAELLLRMAVAAAHMGDKSAAEQSLAQLASATGLRPSSDVVDLIVADVKQTATQNAGNMGPAARDWHMALGHPGRTGHMPSLPEAATSRTLSELWVREYPLAAPQPANAVDPRLGGIMAGPVGPVIVVGGRVLSTSNISNLSAPASREDLIGQWRAGGWRPTGRLLFDGGKIYLKTTDRLLCFSAAALNDQPVWQSAWENRYELDGMSQQLAMMSMQMGLVPQQTQPRPRSLTEVLLFGDRVHQSLAIAAGVVYSLEGKRASTGEVRPQTPAAIARGFQWGSMPRRTRSNWLTAYQTSGGKALWTRPASDEDKEGSADVGYLSAPVPCGSLLVAPVTDGGTMWLYGLDRATGKTVWKSYLCDEPQGGASPWAEVTLAVEGREAYLSCGCGVVFAVDAVGGTLRWAVRYQRDGKPNPMLRNYGNNFPVMLDLSGWDDDVVIPYGTALIVMSSDSDKLAALDRRTGELLWESPRISPFGSVASYCLGVHGRGLFVAGKNVVRRYDFVSGRLVWEREIEDSFGRGCVTDDALYLPVRDSILKIDLEKGHDLAQVGVALTSDEPVGNLFSDGEKLWVVGAGRVYAMTTLEHRLAMLAEQIAAGDGEAQLNRMRLRFKQNRLDLALADLRGAYALFQAQMPADDAAQRLFAAVHELKLAQNQPLVALNLLVEQFAAPPPGTGLGRAAVVGRDGLVARVVSVIRQQKTPGAIPLLLAATPLLLEDYLLTSAMSAVDVAATTDDATALLDALQGDNATAQLLAIRPAARLIPDDARRPLAKLMPAGDDRVRLAAARALANLGERKDVLETLVALLESENTRVRARSYQTLRSLTGQQIAFLPEAKAADRAAAVKAWQQWLETSGATAALLLPLSEQAVPLGRTLFVSQAQGTVTELDSDRKQRWQIRLPGPAWGCQGLPNGHRLIAVYAHNMVIEYDDTGKEVWKKDRLSGPPYSVQRLDNGNTLVACPTAQQLVEISPDGNATAIAVPGGPFSAQRLENGNTLVALQQGNRVVEVDRAGKIVWEAHVGSTPFHAVRLDSGNTLVCLTQGRQVVELDPTGKALVWRTQVPLTNPYAAQRLPSGNTLVADHMGLHEIDASGKQVWDLRQPQLSGLSSF